MNGLKPRKRGGKELKRDPNEKEIARLRKENERPAKELKKAELLAMGPTEVCSWDITKLKGPVKWSCFHLYVILDIFSRCVVGWMV